MRENFARYTRRLGIFFLHFRPCFLSLPTTLFGFRREKNFIVWGRTKCGKTARGNAGEEIQNKSIFRSSLAFLGSASCSSYNFFLKGERPYYYLLQWRRMSSAKPTLLLLLAVGTRRRNSHMHKNGQF